MSSSPMTSPGSSVSISPKSPETRPASPPTWRTLAASTAALIGDEHAVRAAIVESGPTSRAVLPLLQPAACCRRQSEDSVVKAEAGSPTDWSDCAAVAASGAGRRPARAGPGAAHHARRRSDDGRCAAAVGHCSSMSATPLTWPTRCAPRVGSGSRSRSSSRSNRTSWAAIALPGRAGASTTRAHHRVATGNVVFDLAIPGIGGQECRCDFGNDSASTSLPRSPPAACRAPWCPRRRTRLLRRRCSSHQRKWTSHSPHEPTLLTLLIIAALVVLVSGIIAFIPKLRGRVLPPLSRATTAITNALRSPRHRHLVDPRQRRGDVIPPGALEAYLVGFGGHVSFRRCSPPTSAS